MTNDYLPFIIIGLITGSVYGISAIGLVLTYKTSGVFNIGHGAVSAASAFVFYELSIKRDVPTVVSVILAVVVFGVFAGLLLERLAAGLAGAAVAYRIVATLALILIIPAIYTIVNGPITGDFTPFLSEEEVFTVGGVIIGVDKIVIAVIGLVSVVSLFVFFRISKLGVAMRAVVDRPELVDLTGDSPARVRRIAWVIGSSFAAISGLLLANQQQQLDITLLSLLAVQAFGAAAVGAFRSIPLAYAGGLILGVVQAFTQKFQQDYPSLNGLDGSVPFLFLFIGLLVIPKGRLVELGQKTSATVRTTRLMTDTQRNVVASVAVLAFVLVPHVVGSKLPIWTTAVAFIPLFLSLGLLVRTSGQISLCQVGFAAIGAAGFAHMQDFGLPWLLALLVGALIAVPVGALIAIPAIRLSGLFLALATLGFGILLSQFFYVKDYMFGQGNGLPTTRPAFAGLDGDKGYYYALLAFAAISVVVVLVIERSRLGRLLRGMSESPGALSMLGTNTNITKVLIFCISAFLAGISGGLLVGLNGTASQEGFVFFQSLVVLAVLMIFGQRTVPAAILGSIALNLLPAYVTVDPAYFQLAFGVLAIVVAVSSGGRLSSFLASVTAKSQERAHGPGGARRKEPSPQPQTASVP